MSMSTPPPEARSAQVSSLVVRALHSIEIKDFAQAIQLLEEASSTLSPSASKYARAFVLSQMNSYEQAIRFLEDIKAGDPDFKKAQSLLTHIKTQSAGNSPKTISEQLAAVSIEEKAKINSLLDQSLGEKSSLAPTTASATLSLDEVITAVQTQNFAPALQALDLLIPTMAVTQNLHYLRGVCLVGLRNLPEARLAMQRELELFPNNAEAAAFLADINADLGLPAVSVPPTVTVQELKFAAPTRKLKFMQIHGFYDQYLAGFYEKNPQLVEAPFAQQIAGLVKDGFSAAQLYAPYMQDLGYESNLVIGNCPPAQVKWCIENGAGIQDPNNWKLEIARQQVDHFKPDVLYLGDCVNGFDATLLRGLKHKPALVIGWRAATIPDGTDWTGFDLLLSGLSALREIAPRYGVKETLDFYPGYPVHIHDQVQDMRPIYDLSFCGQWTHSQHPQRNYLLQKIAQHVAAKNYSAAYHLSGDIGNLPPEISRIQKPSCYGVAMHRALASGRITFDARGVIGTGQYHEIKQDLAKKETTNMRLFEATGSGAFLLTEHHDNLIKYFEPGKEIVTFHDENDLISKIDYYLKHPEEREKIAAAGQARCLGEHSMPNRARALAKVIEARLPQELKKQVAHVS